MRSNQKLVYYVLYDDGTWAGAFEQIETAKSVAKKDNGYVIEGKWLYDTPPQEEG